MRWGQLNLNTLTTTDWFQFLGVIVAALLGVSVAIWGQWAARRASYVDRLDSALAALIVALGQRAIALEEWSAPTEVPVAGSLGTRYSRGERRDEIGGPLDAPLQTAVDAAYLLSRRRADLECMKALADTTFSLKLASAGWQISRLGQIAASIRKWRTGELSPAKFLTEMHALKNEAEAGSKNSSM